jgi:hypothetical protein
LTGIGLAIPATVSAVSIPVTCGTQSGGVNNGNQAPIVAVRLGHQTEDGGFDRFVLEFNSSTIPPWTRPKDFRTGFPQLEEAYELEDFEGYVQWGLGLQQQSCKRILQLSGPDTHTRLVIDVPN